MALLAAAAAQAPMSTPSSQYLDTERGTFASFGEASGLDRRLLKAIARSGYTYPTLVQSQALPLALAGKDLLIRARTGSGKTAAYALAILQKLLSRKQQQQASSSSASNKGAVSALVLVPSRELVDQTAAAISSLAYYCNDVIRVVGLGGGSHAEQAARLADGADIVVATPGRAVAHINSGSLPAGALRNSCDTLVVDEADMVLSYGGGADTKSVVSHLPRICQSLLVSATLSPALNELKRLVLHSPVVLKLEDGGSGSGGNGTSSSSIEGGGTLTQFYVRVGSTDRFLLLFALIKLRLIATKALIFVHDVDTAYRLRLFLERFGIGCGVLDATLPASARRHALESFNRGGFDYLVATEEMLSDDAAAASSADDDEEDEEEDEGEGSEESSEDEEEEESEGESGIEDEDDEDDESSDAEEEASDDDDADEEEAEADGEGSDSDSNSDEEEEDCGRRSRKRRRGAEAATSNKAQKPSKSGAASSSRDAEYGVTRGLDFRGVATVVNFDFPLTAASYTHRVGRTARGGASGVALSFLPPEGAVTDEAKRSEAVLAQLHKASSGSGSSSSSSDADGAASSSSSSSSQPVPSPLPFDTSEVEGFRYRVEDVLRSVTSAAVKEARRAELKRQMLASEALRAHFEDHPRDLALLSATAPVAPGAIKPHLKDVPTYLLPAGLRAAVEAAGGGVNRKAGGGGGGGNKRKRGGQQPAQQQGSDGGSGANTRLSGEEAVAQATEEVYHARRNNVDPLRSLAAARTAASALAAAHGHKGKRGGGGGGRGRQGARGVRR